MTRNRRIRTTWASLSLSGDGRVVVCVTGNGTPHCMSFASLEHLRQTLAQKTLVARRWAVAVPRDLCILKSVSLPAADLDEAARMLEFEVPSLVPLPVDEVIYGCTAAGMRDNLLNVLVHIVKADALERHLATYAAAGIQPQRVTPDVLAIHAWFAREHADTDGPAVFVTVAASHSLILTSNGHSLQGGPRVLLGEDGAAHTPDIALEVLHQSRQCAASPQDKVAVLLAGPPELVSHVETELHQQADGAGVMVDIRTIPGPEVTRSLADDDAADDNSCLLREAVIAAGLLELSADPRQTHTNLVPRGYVVKERRRTLLINGVRVGIMSLLLLGLMWACLEAANRRLVRACELIGAQIAPIEKVAGGVDRKRQRLLATQRQLSNRGRIAEVIAELYECTPQEIFISELDVAWKQGTMTIDIKGQADLLPTAFEYTDAVREAKLLRAMQIVNAQQIPQAGGGSIVEFRARCSVGESAAGVQP